MTNAAPHEPPHLVPGQVFLGPEGPAFFVRVEGGEAVLCLAKNRMTYTRRVDPALLDGNHEDYRLTWTPPQGDLDRLILAGEHAAMKATLGDVERVVFDVLDGDLDARPRAAAARAVAEELRALYRSHRRNQS